MITNTPFIVRFLFARLCPTVEMSKEAQSSLDNLWIFKFGFIPYLKIIQIFLTKLIRPTLTKALLKVLSYERCFLLLPEFVGLFLPRCPFGWKHRPVLFHNKLGWRIFGDDRVIWMWLGQLWQLLGGRKGGSQF